MKLRMANKSQAERTEAVRPFVDRLCKVTFRSGSYGDYTQEVIGVVVGASFHATNGNSTGDLVVRARPGRVWRINGAIWEAESVALVHIGTIEVIEE